MEPLFAIITATYNAAHTVGRTLESVDLQTCRDYEHYIIDGASKDNTIEIVKSHTNSLRIVRSEPDLGIKEYQSAKENILFSSTPATSSIRPEHLSS